MPAQASAQPARARNLVRTADLVAELSLDIDAATGSASGHALRTCFLAVRAAEALGMADRERSALFYAALLHDAGEDRGDDEDSALPARRRLIPLPRRIDDERRETLRARAHRGAGMVLKAGFGPDVALPIMALHERWDGRGLPFGLGGEGIPLTARLIALCHDLDGLVAERDRRYARETILARSGSWYDPHLADLLLILSSHGLLREAADARIRLRVSELEPSWLIRRSEVDDAAAMRAALGLSPS
ncbi:MAG TPA: HD domain-containing phosphohydrolase [Candidatus Saccharimonadales bacterium]|nr:HD domain-containing phosphohydrolase [Candidatus Saccharimonadales bacterium]